MLGTRKTVLSLNYCAEREKTQNNYKMKEFLDILATIMIEEAQCQSLLIDEVMQQHHALRGQQDLFRSVLHGFQTRL